MKSRTAPSLIEVAVWAIAVVLIAGPFDAWLDASMARLIVLQMPVWFFLGWWGASMISRAARPETVLERCDGLGLGGLAFAWLTVLFWMIPRSVDAVGSSAVVDQVFHASMLLAGATAKLSAPRMPVIVKVAIGIYGSSMAIALGFFYSSYSALLCGAFSIQQQRELGRWLLWISPVVTVAVLFSAARALGRRDPNESGDDKHEPTFIAFVRPRSVE